MKKVYRNYFFLLLVICQCGWIIVGNNSDKSIEKGISKDNEKEKTGKVDKKSNRLNKKARKFLPEVSILNSKNLPASAVADRPLPAIKTPALFEATAPEEENEYYMYNSESKTFEPSENLGAKMGFDPVRFTIQVNQDSIELGKEFEIKIVAEFLDVSPRLMFQLEGSNEFSLKMVMPKGFVNTGGTYYDFVEGKVDNGRPQQEFTIKGFLESKSDNLCFILLRSFRGAGAGDVWVKRNTYCPPLRIFAASVEPASIVTTKREKLTTCTQDICIDSIKLVESCKVRITGKVKNVLSKDAGYLNLVYHSCGACNGSDGGNVVKRLEKPGGVLILKGDYIDFSIEVPLSAIENSCNNHFDMNTAGEAPCNIGLLQLDLPKLTASNYFNPGTGNLSLSLTYGGTSLVTSPQFSWEDPYETVVASTKNAVITDPKIGSGYYKVTMTFSGCSMSATTWASVPCVKPLAPTIDKTSTDLKIPLGSNSVDIIATCPSSTTPSWTRNSSGIRTEGVGINASPGSYTVKCEKTKSCYSHLNVTVDYADCETPASPVIYVTGNSTPNNNPVIPIGASTINLEAVCPSFSEIEWPNGSSAPTYNAPKSTFEVKCKRVTGGGATCESSTIVNVTKQPCGDIPLTITATPASLTEPGDVAFSLSGCSGLVDWTPALRENNTQYVNETTTFTAKCTVNGCSSEVSKTITVTTIGCATPAKPVIEQKSPAYLPTGASTLDLSTATECAGTLVWNNNKTGSLIKVGTGSYYVSCVISEQCYSKPSETVEVKSCLPPNPPGLSATKESFNNGGGPTTLHSSGCLGTVMWDHDLGSGYTKNVTVTTTTTYHAYCIVNDCNSSETPLEITVDCSGATTPSISVLSSNSTSTTLQAVNCSGLVIWNNDPNQTGATRAFSDGGNYFATCKVGTCESQRSNTLYLGGGCGDYEVWAYANATANPGSVSVGDNLVLMAGVTGRPSSDYHFEWHFNNNSEKISGSESPNFTIPNVKIPDNVGSYQVHVRRLGSIVTCVKSFNVQIASCNLHAGASWVKNGATLNFSYWADKDLTGATFDWTLPDGTHVYTGGFNVPATSTYKGNYTLSITLRGCTVNSVLNNVNFDAIPDFEGSVEYVWCDVVKGRAVDKANTGKKVNVKLMVNGVATDYQETVNGKFQFSLPNSIKNGQVTTINVRLNEGNNETALGPDKSITCCELEFTGGTPVVTSCNSTTGKGKATIAIAHGPAESTVITYRLLKKFYNEAQQVYYEPITAWDEIQPTASSFDIDNLNDGHYKVEIMEGNTCLINAVFTIDCESAIAGCKPPRITITPSDTVREGVGIIPTLYAEFIGTRGLINTNLPPNSSTPPDNGFGSGLYLNGNATFNLTAIDDKETFTFEAWIKPDETRLTTVGFIGGGEKHYYLIQSVYQAGIRFQLSAGYNGLTLIESLGANKRVALSYENTIAGLTHIALVYLNNLPTLYINGNPVASAANTFHQQFSLSVDETNKVLAGRQVGFHSNLGFAGHIDEIRAWSVARTQEQIQLKMGSKVDETLVQSNAATYNQIDGYWVFDEGANYGFKNLRHPTDVATVENATTIPISTFPTYQIPALTWYEGNSTTSIGTGPKYTMPASKVRADEVTYKVKYTGENGVPCETSKTVFIKRAEQNILSGCFFMSPNYETTRKVHFAIDGGIPRLLNTRNNVGEDGIWKFEHEANGVYRVILPYSEQLVSNGGNGVQLAARVTGQQNQTWKFKFIDSLVQNPTIKLQSKSNNQFLTSTSNTAYLSMSADAGPTANSQIFKLEKTTCPVAPKPCENDSKITIEKITGVSAATATYLEQNEDLLSSYVTKFRGGGKTVSQWGTNTTRMSFSGSIPENDVRTDNFVVRLTGYFCAPGTGEFEFGLVGVDKSQMFISPSEEERTKERLVKNTATVGWDTWNNNNRAKYYMTQNRSYYVEASMLVKSSTVEHLKLGVEGPGINDGPSSTMGVLLKHFKSSPRDKKPARIRDDSEACGKVPEGPLASDDLSFLMKGDTIFAGDFQVIVDAVTGANGTFSGTGMAKVKYMFDTPIKVRFDGVRVNDYYDLVTGEITTEYDKEWKNVVDVDTLVKDVIDGIKSFADGADKLCKFEPDKYSGKALTGMEKPLFDAAAKEIEASLAQGYKDLYNGINAKMAIIDANRAACKAIPPDQAACTAMNTAITQLKALQSSTCPSLESQRAAKLDAFALIIKETLQDIANETNSLEAQLTSAQTSLQLSTPTTSTLPTVELEAKSFGDFNINELGDARKALVIDYYKKEVAYNRFMVAKYFSKVYANNDSEHKRLGADLAARGGEKLGKFINDNLNTMPRAELKQKVKDILYEQLFELQLSSQVYEK